MSTVTIDKALETAVELHRAGNLSEAEAIYRRILEVEPYHADALHLLGVIANQVGRSDLGADLITKAIEKNPNNEAYLLNLGNAFRSLGRFDRAVAAYQSSIQLKPDYAEAYNNMGIVYRELSQTVRAMESYRKAVELRPDYAEAHNNLGILLTETGRVDEAIDALNTAVKLNAEAAEYYFNLANALRAAGQFDRATSAYENAINRNPGHADAYNNLGCLHDNQGDFSQAIVAFRKAIENRSNHAGAHNNLGRALTHIGQLDEAVSVLRSAVLLNPNHAGTYNNLGIALHVQSKLEQAVDAYRKAIELEPRYVEAFCNLGVALIDQYNLDEAIEALQTALAIDDNCVGAYSNLGFAFKEQGHFDKAVNAYRRALEINPQASNIHSSLIYLLLFCPDQSERSTREAHRSWNSRFAEPFRLSARPYSNDRTDSRRLRIGYVSPNFSGHVISHFLLPLLEHHDHSQYEIYGYASVKRPDAVTERMQKSTDVWKNVLGMTDEAVAREIHEDKIDILIDLTQHMAENRLPVFSRKPAPLQVAWLGYPGTTGVETMDFRITDRWMEPEGSVWSESIEKVVRLPDSWFSFDPLNRYPDVTPPPSARTGYLTFGCLNNFCKVNEQVLHRWLGILKAIPKSRLLLRCPSGTTHTQVLQYFRSNGIDLDRIVLVSRTKSRAEFLELFQQIDIALDPFPYNGGTTTCEALWMGIPVLTLPGKSALSRIGLSILNAANMPEFVADNEENYLSLAREFANDIPQLAKLRLEMRERMRASNFMNYPKFARDMEDAYRRMWMSFIDSDTREMEPSVNGQKR